MEISKSFDIRRDKEAKLSIILSIYSSMVSYSQELRGAVERLTIWGCGLILLLDGWLVTSQNPVSTRDRIVISIGIVGFILIVVMIIRSLQQRFNGFAQVIRRVNQVQMVYEHGVFLENDILFPEHWKNFGSPKWKEPIFRIAYVSLTVVGIFGVIAVWLL
jgi:hypothetical protein